MKYKSIILILSILTIFSYETKAQKFSSPSEYLTFLGNFVEKNNKDSWDYINAIARNKNARKIEARRKDLLQSIEKAIDGISKATPYEGAEGLKDSTLSYLRISKHVMNAEYGKLVDMEEISEQSYDNMEAYLKAKQLADEKIADAVKMVNAETERYALSNGMSINGEKSKISQKLEIANVVFDYYNPIYLIFFKSFKQDFFMVEAMNKGDVNGIEQNKKMLASYAEQGQKQLDAIKAFQGDLSLKNACDKLLKYYCKMIKDDIPVALDYYIAKDKFEKTKTAFDSKKQNQRTKADVDNYNNAVNEFNAVLGKFNKVNEKMNMERTKNIEFWNNTVTTFLDRHIPKNNE